ncbi:hypothetical protein FQA47_011139 [Oryzias melastigma]|uniref:Uncharacterized protein n=1 Tax=Oryzias melastigma TaxID=30732 RepID=A0A834KVU4_ORYME|nr:hypothetical protein FQA47_011139 [Oryzias melastigma]
MDLMTAITPENMRLPRMWFIFQRVYTVKTHQNEAECRTGENVPKGTVSAPSPNQPSILSLFPSFVYEQRQKKKRQVRNLTTVNFLIVKQQQFIRKSYKSPVRLQEHTALCKTQNTCSCAQDFRLSFWGVKSNFICPFDQPEGD